MTADEIVVDIYGDLEEEDDEVITMPFSEDATDHEPVFRCDFCKGLEDELSTSKKHCIGQRKADRKGGQQRKLA